MALLLRALGTDEHAVALDYAETDVRLQVRVGCRDGQVRSGQSNLLDRACFAHNVAAEQHM